MIKEIKYILNSAHSENRTLLLHEIIWTVDKKLNALPSAEEMNTALSESPSFRLERKRDEIHLIPSSEKITSHLSNNDILIAMKNYENIISKTRNKKK